MLRSLSESLDPRLFWEYRQPLLGGMVNNLVIFGLAAVLASLLALAVGLLRSNPNAPAPLRWLAVLYAELFRNTPEYVILVWSYYVLPLILSRLIGIRVTLPAFSAAVLALGFAYSGFLSETVRTGIQSVPRGQREAALALGMSRRDILWRIIFPQGLRRVLPDALNQYVSLFKATSIVSLISVEDIMYRVSMVNVDAMRPLPLYTGAALVFCAVVIAASQGVQALSRRWRERGWA
jgi:polar amino acid transport system permease protein